MGKNDFARCPKNRKQNFFARTIVICENLNVTYYNEMIIPHVRRDNPPRGTSSLIRLDFDLRDSLPRLYTAVSMNEQISRSARASEGRRNKDFAVALVSVSLSDRMDVFSK